CAWQTPREEAYPRSFRSCKRILCFGPKNRAHATLVGVPAMVRARACDLLCREEASLDDEALERAHPAVPVRRVAAQTDLVDEPALKLRPWKTEALDDGERHREGAALPRGFEHELAVSPRQRGGSRHAGDLGPRARAHGRAVPIMESRVTSFASSASSRPGAAGGGPGRTR